MTPYAVLETGTRHTDKTVEKGGRGRGRVNNREKHAAKTLFPLHMQLQHYGYALHQASLGTQALGPSFTWPLAMYFHVTGEILSVTPASKLNDNPVFVLTA